MRLLGATTLALLIAHLPVVAGETLPKFYGMNDPGLKSAFEIEAQADIRARWHTSGEIDIGVGEVRNGVYCGRSFTRSELLYYWSKQAKGKFVCIMFDKNNLPDAERSALIESLTKELFDCGVTRVRIHQGYSAGVEVLSDATNPASKK